MNCLGITAIFIETCIFRGQTKVILTIKLYFSRTVEALSAKSNLVVSFFGVCMGLHLVVNPLYLHPWIIIVDFNNDTPNSIRLFLDLVRCDFFSSSSCSCLLRSF